MKMRNIFFFCLLFFVFSVGFAQNKETFNRKHAKPVIAVLFNPDGKSFASVCADKTIKIWDIETGKLTNTLSDKIDGDVAISYSPDGKYLASGSWDNTVKLWDTQSGQLIRRFIGHSKALRTVDFHPSGNFLASAGWDHEIKIWYVHTGVNLKTLRGHNQCIRALKYSPDGNILASGGYDLMLKTWDVTKGVVIDSVKAHKYPIESLDFSPDGNYIVTGSADNTIKIWETKGLKLVAVLKGHTEGLFSVCYSPGGKYIASGSNDKTLRLWSTETYKEVKRFNGHTLSVKSVSFSPSGKRLVSGSTDKTVRIWDISEFNIQPIAKPKSNTIKLLQDNNAITWLVPNKNNYDVLNRDFTIKFKINHPNLQKFKLFVNKEEYIEYDGDKQYHLEPNILQTDNGFELEYNIYLLLGENNIQLFGETKDGKEYAFSNEYNIFCHDFTKLSQNPDFFMRLVNLPGYNDKRISSGYSSHNTDKLKNIVLSQKGKMYKDVIWNEYNTPESCTKESIEENLNKVWDRVGNDDLLFIGISAQIVSYQGNNYILPYGFSDKDDDIETNAVNLDILKKEIEKNYSYCILYINADNSLEKSKNYTSPNPSDLFEYFSNSIEQKFNMTLIITEGTGKDNIFDIFAHSFHKENDTDHNQVIEISEVKDFLQNLTKIYFEHQGYAPPLFVYFDE